MANQLLSAPQAGSPIISFEDGWRLYERYPCHLPTSCQPASTWGNPESKWASTILNISTAGICLNVARRFEKGTGLAIELPADSGRQAYTVLGKVVYVRPQKDGSWTHGCAFLSELNEDEIQRLLDASEKRRSVTQLPRRAADRQVYSNVHCEL